MPKLPMISGKEMIKALNKLVFIELRQKGSHVILRKDTEHGAIGCVVPIHKELAPGTARGILKQAKITEEEFLTVL